MVSALILTVLFTSGISLTFRNQPKNRINGDSLFGFLILILAGSLLVGSISTLLLKYFSYLQGSLPTSIYIACFLYSALGCINLGVTDGLIANGNLRLASYFDFSSIIFQLLFLFFLVQLDQTTIFMSIMISFIVSYLLITFAAFSVFFHAYAINVEKMFKSGINLIVESKNNQIFGIANGFIDRMDRFIIGLALPLVLLAKYSLITGIISYSRFLPEAINKLRVQKLRQSEHNVNSLFFKRSSSRITNLVVAIISMGLTFLAMTFVSLIFGKEWSLPIEIPLLFTLQELMRAAYQMKATTEITNGNSSYVNRLSLFLLIFSTLLMILGVNIFGIIAAPLSMIITYSVLIYVISRKIWVLS
jgi:O-antigen/teichoic acid export membrane protein